MGGGTVIVGGGGPGGGGSGTLGSATQNSVVVDGIDESTVIVQTPEQEKRAKLAAKVHHSILALIDRLQKKDTNFSSDESKFVQNGNAELQIWLTDKSEETLAKLRELGFEIVLNPKSAKLIIGRVPLDKLQALAELDSVRYISPVENRP